MYVVILLWLVNLCLSVTSDRRKWRYGVIFLFIAFVLLISWRSNIEKKSISRLLVTNACRLSLR